ncbi:MAG TPA: gamma-glutamyltransferase [Longimicrobiaceae bacterium]|nr:gamma-glutamyltransferase [Longimicrobiaceae bacterium]
MGRVFRGPGGLFVALVLAASGACAGTGGDPRGEVSPGVFAAPTGWDFPVGTVTPTYGSGGMVVTTDPVATEIGVDVLRRGGNAIDATIATHFALAVVNPEAGNIGGGGFLVVRTAEGENAMLDFREKAPLAASRDMYLDASGELTDRSVVGHLASGVPGSVAGMWEAHRRFGSMPWAELVDPAVRLAEGIVMHERLAESLRSYEDRLRRYPATAAAFLPGGRAPRVGERFEQRVLAETLRRIATDGPDGFYAGRTAELVEAEMRRGGGIMTRQDLAEYRTVWREPIVFGYRGHTILTVPPPSSGGATMAAILKILEGYDLRAAGFHSAEHVHLWAEAVKRAFVDRNAYLADPDFVPQPTARMISDEYAAQRRAGIRTDRATPSGAVEPGLGPVPGMAMALPEGQHTTHYSVVDGQGNAVSVTTTINSLYGSLVTVEGAGFLLNNEMDDFAAKPGTPNQFGLVQGEANAIEPGKRMLSAMTPTIVLDAAGRVRLVTGTPGGPTIITTLAQVVSNVIDFGMDAAAATAAPRLHHQHLPDVLRYERSGLSPGVVASLRALGHEVEGRPGHSGDTQTIMMGLDGRLGGVSDPRRGGSAGAVR